ncbi:MAG: 4-hydroxy-3-methylbut-2-enyl diphosphate reductase [Thermodesulfobacteriota bacterium]
MKVSIAKTSGFCMGVRRAVDMVLDAANKYSGPIQTFGPLIHNPQVLALLAEKRISVMETIPEHGSGIMLIRAHGVPPETIAALEKAGYTVIDATCPRVIRVQTIIRKYADQGYASIIIGDEDHPEVIGLLGFAGNNGYAVNSLEKLKALPAFDKAIIVAQTTQSVSLFEEVTAWAAEIRPHYKVFNTICPSTRDRQAEVKRLADSVDAVIVVGGQNSGNTQRLAQISRQSGKPVYHVETSQDIDFPALSGARHIGITAGASTPNWIIKKIYRELEAAHYQSKGPVARRLFMLQRLLLLTNIYLAVGAGFLCYCASVLRNAEHFVPHIFIAMLYIFSMHTLNRLTGIEEDRYNDPYRAVFYEKNMFTLAVMAICAGGLGLMVALALGLFPFLLLLIMSLLGLSYNIYLVPEGVPFLKIRRIKDIPGSKTLLISAAWGIAVCAFPAAATKSVNLSAAVVTLWCTGLVFVRSAFFDIIDMQGDRIAGKETIPIRMGAERALRFLKYVVAGLLVLLLLATLFKVVSGLGYVLLILPVTGFLLLSAYKEHSLQSGALLEFLVESQFILAGFLCLIWSALT